MDAWDDIFVAIVHVACAKKNKKTQTGSNSALYVWAIHNWFDAAPEAGKVQICN